jgi:hypothetical protein
LPTVNSFDGIKRAAIIASGAAVSSAVNIPRNCAAVTIFTPSALTTSTTWKLQLLTPDQPEGTTWVDAYGWEADSVAPTTPTQLSFTFTGSTALTIPTNLFGGGTFRIAVADNQGADRLFYCFFSGFQN